MGYKTEKLEMPLQPGQVQGFEYALLYRISGVELARAAGLQDIDWEECQEAREIHVFDTEEGKQAVLVSDDGDGGKIVKLYKMAPRFSGIGRVLKVAEYTGYDEDGQMRVVLTRLAGVE